MRIICARSKLEEFVDKVYPTNKPTGQSDDITYGKPQKLSYGQALHEMLTSRDHRFTLDPYVCMMRGRIAKYNITRRAFIKFGRLLYGMFSDKACHKMCQYAPPMPKYDDTEAIAAMLQCVQIEEGIPALKCLQIVLQPMDMPDENIIAPCI